MQGPPPRAAAQLTPGLIPKAAIRKGQATPTSYSPRNGINGLSARPDLAGSAALGHTGRPLASRGQGGGPAPSAHRPGRQAPNKAVPAAASPARVRWWVSPGRVPAAAPARGTPRSPRPAPASGRGEPEGRRGGGGAAPPASARLGPPASAGQRGLRGVPEPWRLRAQLNSGRPSQVYFSRTPAPRAPVEDRVAGQARPGRAPRGRHWLAGAGELPRCAAPAARAPPRPPGAAAVRGPSPCSGAPSGGGSSSSDLRCWGLACLRRDMLLAARGPRAGQRHQRGGQRGRRGAAGRARGAGRGRRRRRLRGPRMGLSN